MNKMMRLFLKDGRVIWVRETISTFLPIFTITITSITSIVTKSMRKPYKKSQKAKQMRKPLTLVLMTNIPKMITLCPKAGKLRDLAIRT